jgi:O-antigen/teichoic acid export membrane protein
MTTTDHCPRERRKRSILLAVFTSILSKGGNILLMLISIPLAYHVLGEERAAIFGIMQSLMWFVSMADLGTGPGMVRRLAGAVAAGDRERQGVIVSTAFFVSTGLALAGGLLVALLLSTVPLTTIFSDAFAPYESELRQTVWVSLGIFVLLMILSAIERVREGYQEVHIGNAFGSVYNVCAAGLLWLGISTFPSPVFLIVAVYGLLILFCSANVTGILWKRPWLIPSPRRLDRTLVRSMTFEGLALFAAGSVAPILVREAPKFLLGRSENHGGAGDVAHYWILAQLGLIAMGFVMMFTRPLWPAMADAVHRRDYSWVRHARLQMMKYFAPCAVIVVCGFSLLGPWFTRWWLKTESGITVTQFTVFGGLFVLSAWSHLHYVMLGSIGLARTAAKVLLAEAAVILVLTWWAIHSHGLTGSIVASAAGMLAVSAWIMPLALRKVLHAKNEEAAPIKADMVAMPAVQN